MAYQRIEKYAKQTPTLSISEERLPSATLMGNLISTKIKREWLFATEDYVAFLLNEILSSVDRPDKLKIYQLIILHKFNDEFDAAKNLFASGIELPINKVRFEYDKLNKLARIVGEKTGNYELRLSLKHQAVFQLCLLFLVTKYLSE